MVRTAIVAQARMSSTRLPGKTLMDLGGIPVIDHVIRRARAAARADTFIAATTSDPSDDILVEHLSAMGVACVRGSLDDVLSRYVLAADASDADVLVRITCDCPLIDPEVIDGVIDAFHAAPSVDYCGNTLVRSYPIGMDTEVFTREALEVAHVHAVEPHEREHVTPYIYQHPERFRLRNVEAPAWARWPDLRLTVDEDSDLAMLRALVGLLPDAADLRTVLRVIRDNPALASFNSGVTHRHIEKPASW